MNKRFAATHINTALLWPLVLLWVCWVYWPGLAGPEIFDDSSNLNVLAQLEDNPEYLSDVVLGNTSGPTGRPLSMLSFALEKVYVDAGLRGMKQINLMLHLLCGSGIALLLALLLRHAQIPYARWFALLLAAAWLMSPLYVSTVLYPVQRMAQLACLFMVASLIYYSLWRIYWQGTSHSWLIVGLIVPVLLALLSKENAVVVVPILLLLELVWFQCRDSSGQIVVAIKRFVLVVLAFGLLSLFVLQLFYPDWILSGYQSRPFDLEQRLLTQGRILWEYGAQLLWPDVSSMGVFHDDYELSQSLFQPLTTLFSALAWSAVAVLIVVSCVYNRGRYLAFAVLLFLVGHGVESSVLALELYFEHRNYFPGIGLFLLLGLGFGGVVRKLPETGPAVLAMLFCAVLLLSLQTSSQAQIWSQQGLLTLNNVNAHPRSARANIEMAVLLARYGALDDALEYSSRATKLQPEAAGDAGMRALLLSCYANQTLTEDQFDELALWSAQGKIIRRPTALLFLVRRLQNDQCPQLDSQVIADAFARLLLLRPELRWADAATYTSLAILENSLQRFDNALAYTQLSLKYEPDSPPTLLMKLHFAMALDKKVIAKEARDKLLLLAEQGKLSLQQQQTLTLY